MNTTEDSAFTLYRDWKSLVSWKTHWVGLFGLLSLLIFTWLPNSYAYMVGWPYVMWWQVAFLILCGYAFWLSRKFSIPFKRIGYGLDAVVALVLFSSVLSTTASQFQAVACWNLLLVIHYIVCFYLLVNWLRHESITRYFLWAVLVSIGTVTSFVGLALWRPDSSMWLSENFNTAVRNAQPLGHHNFVGGYELLILPIVTGFALSLKGHYKKIALVASGVVAFTVYISGSRGALIGMIALGITTVAMGLFFTDKDSRRRWAISGLCFALIMSLALFSNPRMRTLFTVDPAVDKDKVSIVSVVDGPTKDRVFMAESALNILKRHPILGVGPGNLSRVYDTYRPIEAGVGLSLVQQLHNTPVQLAAELGILGLFIYLSLLFVLVRLGVLLHQRITNNCDHLMLYAVGGSWLGYSISSLSDYQLENIGITTTLIVTAALLVNLADSYKLCIRNLSMSKVSRRIVSLGLVTLICISLKLWVRADAGFYLSYSAIRDTQRLDFVGADSKLAKASKLVPWDPTYPALAAEAVLKLIPDLDSEKDVRELSSVVISYFKDALEAAPNDTWFNQNLAVLLLESDAEAAESYARRAVQLSPRNNNNYTYYTLGLSLLNQGKIDTAVYAFVLESLANPLFLTADVWEYKPLAPIKNTVVRKSLENYRQILKETSQASIQYRWLYDQLVILSWWYDYPTDRRAEEKVTTLAHAMLIADSNPSKSLALLNQYIEQEGRSNDLFLMQARLAPDQYLPELTKKLDMTDEEKETLEESVRSEEDMQSWLSEVKSVAKGQTRHGGVFAYRNLLANNIQMIMHPGEIKTNVLPTSIGLFPNAPREYPQLDRHMAILRKERLHLN